MYSRKYQCTFDIQDIAISIIIYCHVIVVMLISGKHKYLVHFFTIRILGQKILSEEINGFHVLGY